MRLIPWLALFRTWDWIIDYLVMRAALTKHLRLGRYLHKETVSRTHLLSWLRRLRGLRLGYEALSIKMLLRRAYKSTLFL